MTNKPKSPKTRRREDRHPTQLSAILHQGDGDVPCEILNACYRGLFLKTDRPLNIRGFIRFSTQLPGTTTRITISGIVIHNSNQTKQGKKHAGAGVKLFGNSNKLLNQWSTFLEQHFSESKPNEQGGNDHHTSTRCILLHLNDSSALFRLYAIDIPKGRIFCPTDIALPLNRNILIQLRVAQSPKSIELPARVLRRSRTPGRIGIEAAPIQMNDQAMTNLWHFLCQHTENDQSLDNQSPL